MLAHLALAATYVPLGREEEARAHAKAVLGINPDLSFAVSRLKLGHEE